MSQLVAVMLSLALLQCGSNDPSDPGTEGEGGSCPGEMPIEFDTIVSGSTADPGWNAEIGDWFDNSDVACTPWGGDYPAPYQVYSIEIPPSSDWDVVVRPEAGVDVGVVRV
jgi:hypothetical protein